ncbi:unnamed protein product [Ostreobium quekettii]|uniref:Uncharacterized protein n=1 Tax=Ostreobium quekettii TaxID=121088 RepID=A0A8S1IMU7_9CHLO|nr:unnamed protein product [Ostreobium quekettii]|eukprot:evm.model.scf_28.6 EVM.evm.TU.scf_28.6   scf_28:142109-142866(+)
MDAVASHQRLDSQKGLRLCPENRSASVGLEEKNSLLGMQEKRGDAGAGLVGWRRGVKRSVKRMGGQPKLVVIEMGRSVGNKARSLSGRLVRMVKSAVRKDRSDTNSLLPPGQYH